MSKNRQFIKQIQKIYQNISQYPDNIKERRNWLLKTFLVANKREEWVNSGFVLPTISFVSLVLVLLTTAILFRSLERSKNATNVRVNEAVLNAATPAIDRAKAKLNKLFSDSRLPRATPTDTGLASHFVSYTDEYSFGDETQLKLTQSGEDDLRSVWKFPVDTDNNGKFDSYTLYGIYFKNPPVSNGVYTRSRNPLEARAIPMLGGNVGSSCGDVVGTSATLVGNSGWFKVGSQLKKSFFVYTANVPITTPPNTTRYEAYKGNKGFSALEYQQERVQLPLVNNAVVYEDDLVLTPANNMNLNGRIITNSNFGTSSWSVATLYQISSQHSCFYEADNSKIIVAGNLSAGGYTDSSPRTNGTRIHLYKGKGTAPNTNTGNNTKTHRSVADSHEPKNVLYNSLAYTERINRLVEAQELTDTTGATDPAEVKQGIVQAKEALGLSNYTAQEEALLRNQQLDLYFRRRTRRIPYQEIGFNGDALGDYALGESKQDQVLQGTGDTLRPPDAWMYPFDPANGNNATNYAKLSLKTNGSNLLRPSATKPEKLETELKGVEQYVGDRVAVGNNLPELWWDTTKNRFVGSGEEDTQDIDGKYWDEPNNTDSDNIRTRRSQIQELPNLGNIVRDGDWEQSAAQIPSSPQEPVGGLRVVTGAGIYLPDTSVSDSSPKYTSLPTPGDIWSDQKPVHQAPKPTNTTIKPYWMYAYMEGGANFADVTYKYDTITDPTTTPYLRMRATAVYHYKHQAGATPLACVSSFYVPTNSTTAKNKSTLPDTASVDGIGRDTNGLSNNGIVYAPPTRDVSDYQDALTYISQLKYDNGRLIDDGLLARAIAKTAANRTLSEQSAIHAQICALQILDGSISVAGTPPIPHGSIRETTFLDARQIKTIHNASPPTTDYDLNKKDREPLEIRATVLDMEQLRTTTIGSGPASTQEYLLPNSGIIYASRDDALPDWSAVSNLSAPTESEKRVSSVDHIMDKNRRPNGIMLVNGKKLWRDANYRDAEKGLILASNVPVYVNGTFNLHGDFNNGEQEEFTEKLTSTWSNFYDRTKNELNPNFACRKNDPRLPNCTVGDEWRPAAVLADAVSILSDNFRLGYRDEGDYDWKPDASTIPGTLANNFFGFSTTNSYVPVAKWRDTSTNLPKDLDTTKSEFQGSSYLNNFITPINLRVPSGAYLTEVCTEADCTNQANWKIVKPDCSEFNVWDDQILNDDADPNDSTTALVSGYIGYPFNPTTCGINASTPRRIALDRYNSSSKGLDPYSNGDDALRVLGVDTNGRVQLFVLGATTSTLKSSPNNVNIPWLRPISSSGNVTRLQPVLQIDHPFATSTDPDNDDKITSTNTGNWLQDATDTTFNLVIASGDVPGRPTEHAGGLHNFPRLLENWEGSTKKTTRINGSFMQIGRSAYASAPFFTTLDTTNRYASSLNSGKLPYYRPSIRQWGYDVGLLSQSPDAFALKLVRIPKDKPDEYYREVGRDDNWVQTLLCAKNFDGDDNDNNDTFAIDASQRPNCP